MKKINKMLGKIVEKMDNSKHSFANYAQKEKFIYKLYNVTMELQKFIKKCYFFDVDFDDGKCFMYKFWGINTFLVNGDEDSINFIFAKLLYDLEYCVYDGLCDNLYEMLKKEICPALIKIRDELLLRGIKYLE